MDLLDSDGNPPRSHGRVLALAVTIWDHIEYMPKDERFPHGCATYEEEGYYYYVSSLTSCVPSSTDYDVQRLDCKVHSSNRIDVVSREITLDAPKNEWFEPIPF